MGSPWFRLQANYYLDRDLRRAGPDARLCWPALLCILKQGRGFASDSDIDPFTLSDIIGGTEEGWERAISGLKKAGLLVEEEKGWTARSWRKFQPDSRPNSRSRPRDKADVPGTPRDPQGHSGTPREPQGTPVAQTMDHGQGTKDPGQKTEKKNVAAFADDHPALVLAEYLKGAIASHAPETLAARADARKLQGWAKDIDLMIRVDHRTSKQIRTAIDSAHRSEDPFWRSNILSGKKLRAKADTLIVNTKKNEKQPSKRGQWTGVVPVITEI
jgi:hypothetical protein